jgi:hypothetical protein
MRWFEKELVEGTQPPIRIGRRIFKNSAGEEKVTDTYWATFSISGKQNFVSLQVFKRVDEGKMDNVPAYVVEEFDDLGQVLQKVLKVQAARRNVTAPQIAHTALQIKAMQGFDISPKPTGRPKHERRNASLKPLPSAKALAKEFDASDRIIRLVQQAMAHPDPRVIAGMLLKPQDKGYLSPTQVSNRLKSYCRESAKAAREATIRNRRGRIEEIAIAANPNLIAPDGLYTIDATEGIKRISPGAVDLVCTSIPYACDIAYDNSIPYDGDYPKFLDTYVRSWLTNLKPALKTGGRIAINFDCTYRFLEKKKAGSDAHSIPHLFNLWTDISNIAQNELGYLLMGYRIWYKQNCSRQFATGSRGSEMPVGKRALSKTLTRTIAPSPRVIRERGHAELGLVTSGSCSDSDSLRSPRKATATSLTSFSWTQSRSASISRSAARSMLIGGRPSSDAPQRSVRRSRRRQRKVTLRPRRG